MGTLCARLQDVGEAGVYRLNCTLDELHAAVERAEFALFEASLAQVHGKGEFLAAMAQAIHAPGWFGSNWDALADALGDLSWLNSSGQRAPGYVLLLRDGSETLGLSAAEHGIASEIFANTVNFWKLQHKPFWVFFC